MKKLFQSIEGDLQMKSSERNFIKRLKKQKEDALEYVVDQYMPLVKAIAINVLQPLGKMDAVDDCVNDVFLSVWQHAHQFEGEMEDFKKWIGMIAKYKAIDLYRTLDKRQQRESQLEAEIGAPAIADVQQALLSREERNELLFELSKLDATDRDIFVMKYFLEMANGAIAEMLGLSKAAIDNRLYRGKKKLAKSLVLKERFI